MSRKEAESGGKGEEEAEVTPPGKGWQDIDFAELDVGPKIGGGGFAIVHRGEWKGETVALKTMVGCA